MPLLITPRQFTQRAEFYHQFRQLTVAGVGVVKALELLARNPPARSFHEPISQLVRQLEQGYTLTDALNRIDPWLPSFDIALLQAGEQSGRLDAVFKCWPTITRTARNSPARCCRTSPIRCLFSTLRFSFFRS